MKRLFTFIFCCFFLLAGLAPAQLVSFCLNRGGRCGCQAGSMGSSDGCCESKHASDDREEVAVSPEHKPVGDVALSIDSRCCLRSYHEPFAPAAVRVNDNVGARLKLAMAGDAAAVGQPVGSVAGPFASLRGSGRGHPYQYPPPYLLSCSFRC